MTIEVLLVDEDRDVLDIVATFLGREDGLEVTPRTDPEAALEDVRSGQFDAVVCDYSMPRMNGIELCNAVRTDGNEIPFILFSAREPDDVQPEADEAGVTTFVQKGTGTEQYSELAERITDAV